MVFSLFPKLYNHDHCLILGHCITPKRNSIPITAPAFLTSRFLFLWRGRRGERGTMAAPLPHSLTANSQFPRKLAHWPTSAYSRWPPALISCVQDARGWLVPLWWDRGGDRADRVRRKKGSSKKMWSLADHSRGWILEGWDLSPLGPPF